MAVAGDLSKHVLGFVQVLVHRSGRTRWRISFLYEYEHSESVRPSAAVSRAIALVRSSSRRFASSEPAAYGASTPVRVIDRFRDSTRRAGKA